MSRKNLFLILIIGFAASVNLLAALAPELGFDALWYHLTISKIYLTRGEIFHIPGGLLYYSAMPRLTELMFIPLIKFFGDLGPHFLSFAAGIGSAVLTYLIARKYLNKSYALLAAAIFYVTPLLGWQSGSAYIDLIRTFWETLTVLLILNKRFPLAGIVLGIAISTKILSLGTIPLDLIILYLTSKSLSQTIKVCLIAVFVGLPWYLLSFLNTGFALYPIGAGILDNRHSAWPQISHPLSILADYWKVFMVPEDLISPIFVIIIPFAVTKFKELTKKFPVLIVYWLLSYLIWWLIPRLGGGRFLLSYLPIWSILTAVIISLQSDFFKKLLISCVLLISIFNIFYRIGAQAKLVNYFSGKETKSQFLCANLNFNFGDFYDCDGFFAKNIKSTDLVLIKGVHNLYYVNFPFVHESWYRNEEINYILVQGKQTQHEAAGRLVYQNNVTKVRLYKIK